MQQFSISDLVVQLQDKKQAKSNVVPIFDENYNVTLGTTPPHSLQPPHTHHEDDQVAIILEGELEFEIGGQDGLRFTAGAGSCVFKPRGVSHACWNTQDTPAYCIEISIPEACSGDSAQFDVSPDKVTFHASRVAGMVKEHGLKGMSGFNMESIKAALENPNMRKTIQTPETRKLIEELGMPELIEALSRFDG